MIDYLLFIPVWVSFFVALLFVPFWIRKAKETNFVWKDMNKTGEENIAGSGGIIAVLGFVIGVLVFIAYRTFILSSNQFLIETLAILTSILFLSGVGLIDDLLGWRKGGLRRRHRLILALFASIPLIVINAGKSEIGLPIIGTLELGLLYPLILIPIGITGATYTFNFLAGFNGLEAGQGILILSALGLVAFLTGSPWLAVISFCMVAALMGFIVYNLFPAKVFPGDSMTYSVGCLIAMIAIFGNFEKIAVFFFIPYIIETVLKSRGKLVKHSFGKPKNDGTLELKYGKIYSLNHVSIWVINKFGFKATEKRVVYSIWTLQIIMIIAGFIIFRKGIF